VYQLRHAPGNEGSNGRMISDWSGHPQPELGVPRVASQGVGQNDIAIMAAAGEERHHRDVVGIDLIKNGVEAGLALMKCHRDFVEEPAPSQRLRNPSHQGVRSGLPPGSVGGKNQCPSSSNGHLATCSCTRSKVGVSRPVTAVLGAGRATILW
jgi:hypothetical protein